MKRLRTVPDQVGIPAPALNDNDRNVIRRISGKSDRTTVDKARRIIRNYFDAF